VSLSYQRIWHDLVEVYGYGHSYESVKRYARDLQPERRVGKQGGGRGRGFSG
jgi:hypothetical protein